MSPLETCQSNFKELESLYLETNPVMRWLAVSRSSDHQIRGTRQKPCRLLSSLQPPCFWVSGSHG